MGIYYSLTDWNGISKKFNFIGLENYLQIFKDKEFIQALVFTMKYSLLLVLFTVVIGVALALLLNSKIKGLSFFRAVYFIPAVLSMLTVGLIFNQIFYRVIPYIGQMLNNDFLSKNLLSSQFTAMWAILFVNLWQGLAIPTLLFLSGLQSIPEDLYEAAALDGASNLQRFKAITLPFLIPVLSVVLVLTLKSGLMVFDYIKSLTEGGPGGTTQSIAILIYNHGFTQNKFAYSIAEAIITGIIISMISAVQISASNRKKV
jgi:raffinose/stachyose/melibiose transport system permease protein